jgi:hypothetical protein
LVGGPIPDYESSLYLTGKKKKKKKKKKKTEAGGHELLVLQTKTLSKEIGSHL